MTRPIETTAATPPTKIGELPICSTRAYRTLTRAGIETVDQLLDLGEDLRTVPGIGPSAETEIRRALTIFKAWQRRPQPQLVAGTAHAAIMFVNFALADLEARRAWASTDPEQLRAAFASDVAATLRLCRDVLGHARRGQSPAILELLEGAREQAARIVGEISELSGRPALEPVR